MKILPDSSILIPYLARHRYVSRIEHAVSAGRLLLCSVVAEEVMAGARDRNERRDYDSFFARFRRAGHVVAPHGDDWITCGRILSRYHERFGAINVRDHQNDTLILLLASRLARDEDITIMTENERHFDTWLTMLGPRPGLRIEAARA